MDMMSQFCLNIVVFGHLRRQAWAMGWHRNQLLVARDFGRAVCALAQEAGVVQVVVAGVTLCIIRLGDIQHPWGRCRWQLRELDARRV